MNPARNLHLVALTGVPLAQPGDDLCSLVLTGLDASDEHLANSDVLVIAQKLVSKTEGRQVRLDSIAPSPEAMALAQQTGKDPRLVQLVLDESKEVVRVRPGAIIVEHRLGFVMANAGIDLSNVEQEFGEVALLLPMNPDASCRALRDAIKIRKAVDVAVIIIDSHGRAFRNGTVGVAIGVAGIAALWDRRGERDLFGRTLQITEVGAADELAAAASLLMGQADEGLPVVLVRGAAAPRRDGSAAELVRPKRQDLFR
jgi:coenzyme F420-0:L-glutamate ligase/coenzyme F420-1:gamma-L-glutamate ligase